MLKLNYARRSSNAPPENNPWEQAFNEGDLPRRNEISIGTIIKKEDDLMRHAQATHTTWSGRDVREAIKRDIEFAEPILRAPVEIAKGENPILALTYRQERAFADLFDMQPHGLSETPYYALVESISGEPNKAEAQIKTVFIRPKTVDHLIISQELARQLGIDPQMGRKDVKILEVYQKIEDIDLDKI